jgi:hypothetical protein
MEVYIIPESEIGKWQAATEPVQALSSNGSAKSDKTSSTSAKT